jgi:hypothetical protein
MTAMKQAHTRDVFRMAFKSVCTSTVVVPFDHLSPILFSSSVMQDSKNTKECLELADEGHMYRWNTSLICCTGQI